MKQFDDAVMAVAKKLDEKKARDIVLLDVSKATILAETFIICSGTSPNQVRMLADEAERTMANQGIFKKRLGKVSGRALDRSRFWRCTGAYFSSGRARIL